MARLPLTLGAFLAVAVGSAVFLGGLLARLTFRALMVRTVYSFLALGLLGVVLGSLLEVLLMPQATNKEQEKVRDELQFKNDAVARQLGDLVVDPDSGKPGVGFSPLVFPRVEVGAAAPISPTAPTRADPARAAPVSSNTAKPRVAEASGNGGKA